MKKITKRFVSSGLTAALLMTPALAVEPRETTENPDLMIMPISYDEPLEPTLYDTDRINELPLVTEAQGYQPQFTHCAEQLSALGLFRGTDAGYELDRVPTRAEAAVMLVRLLGKEEQAKALAYTAPFTDLAGWEKPYVQYLYENGLTGGTSDTTFSPKSDCSAQMFVTFLLRALGYSDKDGDFTYADAIDYARSIGLVDYVNYSEDLFVRDHVAALSLTALDTTTKNGTTSLLVKLAEEGAIAKQTAQPLLDWLALYHEFNQLNEAINQQTKLEMEVNSTTKVSSQGKPVVTTTTPMTIKMYVDQNNIGATKMEIKGVTKVEYAPDAVPEGEQAVTEEPIEYYYTDGVYYIKTGDQKMKMPMPLDDIMKTVKGMTGGVQSMPVSMIRSIAKKDDTYTLTLSGQAMSNMTNSVMGAIDTDVWSEAYTFGDATMTISAKDGALSTMDMTMKMSMNVDGETMDTDTQISYVVKNQGDAVKVTLPTDLNTYVDMETLLQQEEQQEDQKS